MARFKTYYSGEGEFKARETHLNIFAGFVGGAVGSALTNSLDVITINKQTDPELKIWEMVKKERANLLTKGLFARVYYNAMQSVVFFHLVLLIGRIYDVELSDD